MKAPNENFERNEKILEQRNLGRTLKSIGDEFGLSRTQIRLICILHERLKIHIEKHPEANALSTMAQNIIKTHEYDDDFELSYKYLIKQSGCGAKTAREILNYFNIEEKVNEMPYKVRLTGQRQRTYAHQLIDAAPDYSIVTIVGGDRTIIQSDKMWAMVTDVALARPEGHKWTPDTWKAAFMHSLGHQVQFAEGLDGSGPFPLGFKTSKLNKQQMSDLIEVIYEYGSRHGVEWSEKGE